MVWWVVSVVGVAIVGIVEQVGQNTVNNSCAQLGFDVIANDRTLRLGEVAVVVYLQRVNSRGQTIRVAMEGSVGLRNTREL